MRLIDADKLKEDLTRFYDGEVTARQLIDAQPTAEPQERKGKWIPVSEGLPKKEQWDESFLVTVQCEHVDGWDDYVVCGAEYSEYGWDYIPNPIGAIKVVAWMPITIEPYKESEENNE